MTTNINSNRQRDYFEQLRKQGIFGVKRPKFDIDNFQSEYFAGGGTTEHFARIYRTVEIFEMTGDSSLPQMLDQHAGNAWLALWDNAKQGYGPRHTYGDNKRAVCDLVMTFPDELLGRMEAVLTGLRQDIDIRGEFENDYLRWSRDWHSAMVSIVLATPSVVLHSV